jgi:hypothetical protein
MVFKNYFKTSATFAADNVAAEKAGSDAVASELKPPSPQLIRPLSMRSNLSSTTTIGGEASHHVMLSYIFQHQQSCAWIADNRSGVEGAMLRKSRHNYICSPPQLADSPLAHAMDVLNVQVSSAVHVGQASTN